MISASVEEQLGIETRRKIVAVLRLTQHQKRKHNGESEDEHSRSTSRSGATLSMV
jgi:hypothetical protein